jgi:tight adherence protein B
MTGPGGILLAIVAVSAVALLGLWQYHQGRAVQREAMAQFRRAEGERATQRIRGRIGDALRRTEAGHELEDRLAAAGLGISAVDAIAATAGIGIGAALFGALFLPTVLAVALGVAAVAACEGYRRWRLAKRTEAFVAQLPELARSLSNAAAAGLALSSGVEMTANDIDDPARTVLRQVQDELRVGQSVEGAFGNLERRMPSREVAVLVSTLVIQQRAGGDVVHALRGMAKTLDERKETAREVRVLLAEAKQTGYLVVGLGVATPLFLNAIMPGALDAVVGSWVGRVVLILSGGLFITGFALIRQMTKAI